MAHLNPDPNPESLPPVEGESDSPWKTLEHLVDNDPAAIEAYLGGLPEGDAVRALSRVSAHQAGAALSQLPADVAADLVDQVPEVHALEVLERLEPAAAAAILDELPSDEKADLLGELPDAEAEAILGEMDPEDAAETRTLSRYGDDEAGGLMITEYLAYRSDATVADVIDDFRENAERYRDYVVQYAYVVDADEALLGVLRLRDLLLSARSTPVGKLAAPDPISVLDTTSIDSLSDLFERNSFFGVPVVDAQSRLVGVVQRSAIEERLAERSESDYLKSQGIVGGEEIRSLPLLRRSGRRLAWLSVNIVLNVLAASVIAFYQETLESVIALAVFLPIISDMSGCSGNQAVAVSMRELSLGIVRPNELLRVWFKELSVGLLNGLALGLLIGFVAWLWKGNLWLGGVVGAALFLNTLVAVSVGGCVPLFLKRFGMDPALASGPILTTITDMCGFFLALTFAAAVLAKLA